MPTARIGPTPPEEPMIPFTGTVPSVLQQPEAIPPHPEWRPAGELWTDPADIVNFPDQVWQGIGFARGYRDQFGGKDPPEQKPIEAERYGTPNLRGTIARAAQQFSQMGLPAELATLAPVEDFAHLAGGAFFAPSPVGSGHIEIQKSLETTGQGTGPGGIRDNYLQDALVHESLHAFENLLTPQEQAELARLRRDNPTPEGAYGGDADPASHHPGGITPYFDYLINPATQKNREYGAGQYQVPLAIQNFIRKYAPIVVMRAKAMGQAGPPPVTPVQPRNPYSVTHEGWR